MQTANLKNGINKVGIPDLIIMQNAQEHSVPLFTLDRHFALMSKIHGITLYEV
jgi:predicted nucleic acid-binding protein